MSVARQQQRLAARSSWIDDMFNSPVAPETMPIEMIITRFPVGYITIIGDERKPFVDFIACVHRLTKSNQYEKCTCYRKNGKWKLIGRAKKFNEQKRLKVINRTNHIIEKTQGKSMYTNTTVRCDHKLLLIVMSQFEREKKLFIPFATNLKPIYTDISYDTPAPEKQVKKALPFIPNDLVNIIIDYTAPSSDEPRKLSLQALRDERKQNRYIKPFKV